MHVCFVNLAFGGEFDSAEALLRARPLHRGLGEALVRRGHRVDLVCRFRANRTVETSFGTVHLVAPGPVARALGRLAGRTGTRPSSTYTPTVSGARRVLDLEPDIVHWHGVVLHLDHLLLNLHRAARTLTGARLPPVVVHYHGGHPSPHPIGRVVQRYNLERSDRILFTTLEQANTFDRAGLIEETVQARQMTEVSSTFEWHRSHERAERAPLEGNPAVLSVARLDPVKDPLTTLRGFRRSIARGLSSAVLHMFYRSGSLEADVRTYLSQRPELDGRVRLQGPVPHERMERIYNGADVLVQSSRREFSGYALVEAMACGTVPVVTDLPATRAITDGGRIGRLFPIGEAEALASSLVDVASGDLSAEKKRTHEHFRRHLSFERMVERLERIYESLL